MTEHFNHYNSQSIQRDKNKMKITKKTICGNNRYYHTSDTTCYGSEVIPCDENKTHEWIIKIIKRGLGGAIGIGMDSTKCKYINDYISGKKGAYSYWSSGNGYNDGDFISNYGDKYDDGSIIIIAFNGNDNTLSFSQIFEIETKEYKKMEIDDTSIEYRMCVSFQSSSSENPGQCVELLQYSCSDIFAKSLENASSFENKENDADKMRLKQHESKENDTDKMRLKHGSKENDADKMRLKQHGSNISAGICMMIIWFLIFSLIAFALSTSSTLFSLSLQCSFLLFLCCITIICCRQHIKTEEIGQTKKKKKTVPKSNPSPFQQNKQYQQANIAQKSRIMAVEKENKSIRNKLLFIQNENQPLKKENYLLKQRMKSLETECAQISQQKDEYEEAQRARIISLGKEIAALRNERDSIQSQYEKTKSEKNVLIDNYKELQIENKELNEGIKRLKLQQIDEMEYENWNSEQVLIWMLSLNGGRYNKYKDIISKNLFDEGIKGIHLKQINVLDIKGWGIHNFEDKHFLMQKIQHLINQDNDNNIVQQNNEGAETGSYYK